ncbi:MAG: hypothetical protein Q9201_007217, partial [Fulgogasparrea decipioides]
RVLINLAVNRKVAILAYQLNDFISTGHNFGHLIPDSTKQVIEELARKYFRPPSSTGQTFLTGARRARSSSLEPISEAPSWPSDWAVDKPLLRKAIKDFEQATQHLTAPSG